MNRYFKILSFIVIPLVVLVATYLIVQANPVNQAGVGSGVIAVYNGYVGIGTTSPASKLVVVGTDTSAYGALNITDSNGSSILFVKDNGDVGIKNSSPSYNLDVNGSSNISSNLTVGGSLSAGNVTTTNLTATTLTAGNVTSTNIAATNQITIGTTTITTTNYNGFVGASNVASGTFGLNTGNGNYSFPGNVGIGTATPGTKLHVYGNGSWSSGLRTEYSGGGGNGWNIVDGADNKLYFGYGSASAPTNKFIINTSGNVGIGTATPGYPLTVSGNAQVSGSLATYGRDPAYKPTGWGGGLNTWDAIVGGGLGFQVPTDSGNELLYEIDPNNTAHGIMSASIDSINNPYNITLHVGPGAGNIASIKLWNDYQGRGCVMDYMGDWSCSGTKSFVAPDPNDSTKSIYYTALEGPEAATYVRGSAALNNGEAIINLPDNYNLVTDNTNTTVSLTPTSPNLSLYVVSKNNKQIIVKTNSWSTQNGSFDYLVMGVRQGYDNYQVIRPNPDLNK